MWLMFRYPTLVKKLKNESSIYIFIYIYMYIYMYIYIQEGSNENNNKIRKQMNDSGSHMIWALHIKKSLMIL